MTVQTTESVAIAFGNGVTVNFPVGFKFNADADLVVSIVDPIAGTSSIKNLDSDYTVAGAGADGGGSVTFSIAPASGLVVKVSRIVDFTQLTDLRNQGKYFAEIHEDAFDLFVMMIQQLQGGINTAMRLNDAGTEWEGEGFPVSNIGDPVDAQDAATKSWTEQTVGALISLIQGPINNSNNVLYIFPDGSAHAVQDLADKVDPALGAVGIGWRGRNAGEALDQFRYIETFGPTDTPANTKATMQSAINWCATNNVRLRARASEYTVDLSVSSITIPSNFRCDLDGAWIKRATGNSTPHDMWINADTAAGNTGLDIRNVRFDGQRQADSLTSATVAHRFCGLRLVKCSGYLENVRADNTVNGEIQAEGTRGGIMLDRSVDIRASRLFADGTAGSGVFPYQGKNYIEGVWTKNNTGSGFTSYGCDDNDFHHIYSDGSGYSGVSVNGERMRCSFLGSKNSPLNYAGVNIGHDAAGNRATGSVIVGVTAESAAGWGITCIGSPNVTGRGWRSTGAAVNNLRVVNSPNLDIDYRGESGGTDTFVSGAGDHFMRVNISGASANGLATGGSTTKVTMDPLSLITGCGTAGGTTGAVNVANNTEVIVRGKIINNLRYGVISNGASALADIRGATVSGNTVADFLSASSGVLRHERVRTSLVDAMSGSVTAGAGVTTVTVNNANSQAVARVRVWPGNATAVGKQPFVNAVSPGVSFTFTLPSAAAGTEVYYWEII